MSDRNDNRDQGNKPVDVLRDAALKVAIFRNQGENGDYYNALPSRIYTDDKSGEIRETHSLSGSELLRAAHLLTRTHDRISELRAQDKEAARSERDEGQREPARRRSRNRDQERGR